MRPHQIQDFVLWTCANVISLHDNTQRMFSNLWEEVSWVILSHTIGIEPLIFCCNLFFLYSRNPIPQDGNQYLLMPVKRKDGVKVAIKEVMYLCLVCNESTDETWLSFQLWRKVIYRVQMLAVKISIIILKKYMCVWKGCEGGDLSAVPKKLLLCCSWNVKWPGN